jgi:23S rRNA pseudouridine2605 synthase
VLLSGIVVKELSTNIDPQKDEIRYNGTLIRPDEKKVYVMLHKPEKYLVSAKDEFGRKKALDLLPDFGVHLFSIGRLDYMSTGLLLFTNDGDFANSIIHPRYKLPKVYRVKAKGSLTKYQIQHLREGVDVDGKMTAPAKVFVKNKTSTTTDLRMTIFEGRKRQIRRMLKAVDSEVISLKRLQIGDVKLGTLPPGMWRVLKPSEVRSLMNYNRKEVK